VLWTVYLLVVSVALAATLDVPPGSWGVVESPWHPYWLRAGVVVLLAVAVWWLTRHWRALLGRLRRVQPPWLVPVVGLFVATALADAVYPFGRERTTDFIGDPTLSCVPALAATKHVHPRPSSHDLTVWRDFYLQPFPPPVHDRAAARAVLEAYAAKMRAIKVTPAFQRADAYMRWRETDAACAPESRHRVLLASGVLAVGTAVAFGAAALERLRRSRSLSRS
jgi:hypothetical protein